MALRHTPYSVNSIKILGSKKKDFSMQGRAISSRISRKDVVSEQ